MTRRRISKVSIGSVAAGARLSVNDGVLAAIVALPVITIMSALWRANRALAPPSENQSTKRPRF